MSRQPEGYRYLDPATRKRLAREDAAVAKMLRTQRGRDVLVNAATELARASIKDRRPDGLVAFIRLWWGGYARGYPRNRRRRAEFRAIRSLCAWRATHAAAKR